MTANTTSISHKREEIRVTISDMAAALGLTKSTVSRALNNYPDISKSTQLRVKRMAEKLNYQPLSHAQAIKTGRTRSLGLVLQLADHDAQRPFLAEFLAGVSAGASHEGYTLTVASADNDSTLIETFRQLLRERKSDGFILPRARVDDVRVRALRELNVPFVLYGRPREDQDCAWFDIRGEDAMHDAVVHLAGLGHREIGFINGGSVYNYADLRRAGFESGMRASGLEIVPERICENAVTLDEGAAAGGHLLDLRNRPTAIVCAVDRTALGVYRAAAARNLQIGQDLSVIAYDGIQEGAHANPPLTTFSVDNRGAGARLAQLLIEKIRGEAPETLRETVAATFLQRGSTGPAP
ncbi:MAG: LacI family DNA-binding transcriptional regulator [Pseudomonadota bacterium]